MRCCRPSFWILYFITVISSGSLFVRSSSDDDYHYQQQLQQFHEEQGCQACVSVSQDSVEWRLEERNILKKVFDAIGSPAHLVTLENWFTDDVDHCQWTGITCGTPIGTTTTGNDIPTHAVTHIDLSYNQLDGTIPTELLQLRFLVDVRLKGNSLHGTLPTCLVQLSRLELLDLSDNKLTGSLPELYTAQFSTLTHLILNNNQLKGTLPTHYSGLQSIEYLAFNANFFTGTIPAALATISTLATLQLDHNRFTGTLPTEWTTTSSSSSTTTTTTSPFFASLILLNVTDNLLTGKLPEDLFRRTQLQSLSLAYNQFTGHIPGDSNSPGSSSSDRLWFQLTNLALFDVSHNHLSGTLFPDLFVGPEQLQYLDVSYNKITGRLPTEIGRATKLDTINAQSNMIQGTLPNEMLRMNPNLRLNFTDNLITGTIPGMFCGEGAVLRNLLYREFGCDAVLCRPGTFNVHGHATLHSGCRKCPPTKEGQKKNPPESSILGRTSCGNLHTLHGDLNSDGYLSQREILRMLYIDTIGRFWGEEYDTWADTSVHECYLTGVECLNGEIIKLDLSDAVMCSNAQHKPGPAEFCIGIPREIGQLSRLQVLDMNQQHYLRGTIPTEMGNLTELTHLDLSGCHWLGGTIPTELGRLTKLKFLNFENSKLEGKIPSEIMSITTLEQIQLTSNAFTGTIPSEIRSLSKVTELLLSRNHLSGTIPTEIGLMKQLSNLELYSNLLSGRMPTELGRCLLLKRIDAFSNRLTGPIPEELANIRVLQIIHLKDNQLSGTISSRFGEMPYLTWFDVSDNKYLYGTIPPSFGTSASIKDFRLGGNMIYDPIPRSLCSNTRINGGITKIHGCAGVLCPIGTYSGTGHASEDHGCTKCPENTTTIYLGGLQCIPMTPRDILSILYEVLGANSQDYQFKNWLDPDVSVCEWTGITCDENGNINGLSLPEWHLMA